MTSRPASHEASTVRHLPGRIHRAAQQHLDRDHRKPAVLFLMGDDIVALNDLIRSLCRLEQTCSECGGRVCPRCQIGAPVVCDADPALVHHADCQDGCDGCIAAIPAQVVTFENGVDR